jgi:hypothetical protein
VGPLENQPLMICFIGGFLFWQSLIDILESLYLVEKKLESPFSSKLLHLIHPNLPIWDSIVMKRLNLRTIIS